MSEPNLRSALSEHLNAYAEVASQSSRQWGSQVARRVVTFLVVGACAFLTFVIGSFVAILVSWNTPYQWWVAGGILLLCVAGVVGGLIAASRALRTSVAPPWTILADQVAIDLRGRHGEPETISDDPATWRLQNSRAQLQEMMPGRSGAGGGSGAGAKIGLGVAAFLLTTLFRRKARSMGGAGLALTLGLAALRLFRRKQR